MAMPPAPEPHHLWQRLFERHRPGAKASGPSPGGHSETITVDGETKPVAVHLGVWVSSTRARRDKLTQDQLNALRELGVKGA
ncbi:helicase associated domain-containing protein [Streptomyces viridosporus]|uniref:helicase associated domain-containing protein n=1 Tax=Streptomyces viridosporus TaxID=67581 RepID=UPI0009BFC8E9